MMAGLIVKEMPFLFLVTLAALPQVRPRDAHGDGAGLGYGRMAGFLTWSGRSSIRRSGSPCSPSSPIPVRSSMSP